MSEVEAAGYARRRLVAALLGRSEPPPGILRPLLGGVVVTALVLGADVVRRVL